MTPGRGNHKTKELDSAATETVSEADVVLEWKVKGKKLMILRMVNIQHITLNDTIQLVKICMFICTKGVLAQKGHNMLVASVTKNELIVVSQEVGQKAEIQKHPLYPNTVIKKKSAE